MNRRWSIIQIFLLCGFTAAFAQQPAPKEPSFVEQGQQLVREGKVDEALSLYRIVLKAQPDSAAANTGAGIVLDLEGKGAEARPYLQKAIDLAPDSPAKAMAQRTMAISWAFAGNCDQTIKYEQMVIQYYATAKDFYEQGQIADEAARVCLDYGQLDTAYQWYMTGHDLGLKQPDIPTERKHLWEFRWEHAQARIAARKGNQTEAAKHVAAATAILDNDAEVAKQQSSFLPYLVGYVALYRGDYDTAATALQKANLKDPFIQVLLGNTYEAKGQTDLAIDAYRKAAASTAHNAATAYARPYAEKKLGALIKSKN